MTQGELHDAAIVREGEILAGKYRVERVLGTGGMGVVVVAHHVQLDEKVAIKFLLPAMLRNREVVGRFAREARAAVRIKSEHVARVFDVGTLDSGAPYMVMEYLDGRDLAAWLQRHGPLPIEQAVDFILQTCVAVADAHGLGIVHRDLKPANLFCVRRSDGQLIIKVLDFGISKVTDPSASEADGSMTTTSAVMGSPLYMSPEQMQSAKDVDARTDIWALGIILYELLTGSRPFVGQSFAEIAVRVATASFAPVHNFRPEVPASLEGVIVKCLEKDKGQRYGNVAELALALADFGSKRSRASVERIVAIIEGSGLTSTAPPSPPVPTAATRTTRVSMSDETAVQPDPSVVESLTTMAASTHTAPDVRGRPRVAVIFGIASAVSVVAGVGWVLAKHQAVTSSVPAATSAPVFASSSLTPVKSVVLEPPVEPSAEAGLTSVHPVRSSPSPAPPAAPYTAPRLDTKKSTAVGLGATMTDVPDPFLETSPTAAATPPIVPSAAQSASRPQARGKPNCTPPYVIDSAGDRQYKPECL
jgi:serine/threonine-protein kinase